MASRRARTTPAGAVSDQVRYQLALDAGRIGTWTWDPATDDVEWDEQMEACYGIAPGTFDGTFDAYLARVHPEERARVAAIVADARDNGTPLTFEHRAVWPDGSVHWIEARGRDVRNAQGELLSMVGVGIDIDARKQLEEILRETTALRTAALLAHQLEAAERIAELGSWYWESSSNTVTLSNEMIRIFGGSLTSPIAGQQFRDTLLEYAHPEDVKVLYDVPAEALRDHRPYWVEQRLIDAHGPERIVLHRGEVVVDEDGNVVGVRGTTQDITQQRRAEEVLIDTRDRLVRERRAVEVLHETFIRPDFPAIDGYDISAQYVAVPRQPEIGGDWYDAFEAPDGRIVFAVGDVSGHGVRAARLMAKLRHATRAYACLDADPAVVLTRLDAFVEQFAAEDEFATLTLALLTPVSGELLLASAGHPPPALVQARQTRFLQPPVGPIVGVGGLQEHPRTSMTLTLPARAALVFYTDGLVERRVQSLAEGLARLQESLELATEIAAEPIRDVVLRSCLEGDNRSDDACVLVLCRN